MKLIHHAPRIGPPAEALWHEGEASYLLACRADRSTVTRPPADLVAWCALINGEPVGIQVCRLAPLGEAGIAHGVLSWVKPAFRRRGIFEAIQAAVDAALLAQGITAIRSWVVEGPDADAMAAAIVARGGVKLQGGVRHEEYLRPLTAPPGPS